jgi:hypothetical protein
MDENIARIESANEWAAAASPAPDSSELTLEQAANEITRKREEEQGEDEAPIIERRYAKDSAVSLREAADDLSFSKKLESGKELLKRGLTPEQARDFVEAPEPPPVLVGLDGLDPLGDGNITDALSPHKAADLIAAWREKVAAEQAKVLAELTEQPQEQPKERTQEQPQQLQPQPDPVAHERQRIAMERHAVQQIGQMSLVEAEGVAGLARFAKAAWNAFPDIKSPADVAALRQSNPQRYAQYEHALRAFVTNATKVQQLGQVRQQRQAQLAQHQHAQHQQAQQAFIAQQDAIFEQELPKVLPQYATPKARAELQRAAVNTLRGAGLNDQQIAEAWHNGPLRTAAGQVLLARAAAWEIAQTRARSVRQAPLPPVQRPGVAGQVARSDGNLDQVRDLKSQLKTAKGNSAIRIGAELVKAQRKLASGGR